MCPIVPMFTCGLLRSNFSFAMDVESPASLYPEFLLPNSEFLLRHSSLNFRHDLFRQVLGNFLVLPEVHGETAAALRARAQFGGIAEHFRQRNHGLNQLRGAANFSAFQTAAPGT